MAYHTHMLLKTRIRTARKTKVKNKLKALKKKWTAKTLTANKGSNTMQKKYIYNVDVYNICWKLAGIMDMLGGPQPDFA